MNGSAAGESDGSTLEGMIPSDGGERQGDCQNGGARNRELHVGRIIIYARFMVIGPGVRSRFRQRSSTSQVP